MSRRFVLWVCSVVATAILAAPSVFAWGLMQSLDQPIGISARLVHVLSRDKAIQYCVEVADSRFSAISISSQVKKALQLWIDGARRPSTDVFAISEVPCTSDQVDLWVRVGTGAPDDPSAFYQERWIMGRYRGFILVRTDFTAERDGKRYEFQDFERYVSKGGNLNELMSEVTERNPMSVFKFAQNSGVEYVEAYYNTYRVLIHEVGHAYGLCDTYEPQFLNNCRGEKSAGQPSSIMKDSNYFFLQQDDLAGIRRLFQKYYRDARATNSSTDSDPK